jgi:hypothetical protein
MRFNNLFEFPLAYDHPSDAVLTQRFHFQLPSQIPDSGVLHDLPAPGRDFLLGLSSAAARSIMTHSQQEVAFEDIDRSWQRWTGFLARARYRADPFLLALSPTDTELVARAFLSCVWNFKWCTDGTLGLPHGPAVLSGTVREITGHMAALFQDHLHCSPFHNPVGSHFLPSISNLSKSNTDVDPPTKRQKPSAQVTPPHILPRVV